MKSGARFFDGMRDGVHLAMSETYEEQRLWIEIVEELPRAASGKVKKAILRQIIADKVASGLDRK